MKILVFGGTHGNEWTGVTVVEEYAAQFKQQFPKLDLEFIFSNPEAHKINKRFKDEDLNRAFQFLQENRPSSYEHLRAHEIKKQIEAQNSFIIDLHTTTSAMGKTAILTAPDPLNFKLCLQLQKKFPDLKVILSPDPSKKYLGSQSPQGMMLELGPIANNVVDGKILTDTLDLLTETFKLLGQMEKWPEGELEVFEEVLDIYYPQNGAGKRSAFIHPQLQGKDFIPLQGKYLAFQSYRGEDISLETQEKLYPIFINEAAYYPQMLAFTLCRKKKISFPA